MGPRRQEDSDEQACHFWRDFSGEVHRLSAGGEDGDQGKIAAGGVDATPSSPVGSASVESSPDVTPGGDHVARVDAEQDEDIIRMSSCLQPLEPR